MSRLHDWYGLDNKGKRKRIPSPPQEGAPNSTRYWIFVFGIGRGEHVGTATNKKRALAWLKKLNVGWGAWMFDRETREKVTV